MYDLTNENLPHSLPQYCSLIQHGYSTRQKVDENLYIPKVKTSLGKECLSYLGTTFWNDLPIKIRKKPSGSSFRKKGCRRTFVRKLKPKYSFGK